MKKTVRIISSILIAVLLLGTIPIISISSAELSSPFIESIWKNSGDTVTSVVIDSSESIGYEGEVSLFNTTITSKGTRKNAAKTAAGKSSNIFADTFSGVNVAMGGRLFVYSKGSADGQNFAVHSIKDIAAQFEADHPEWKVAVVTNATFFDNDDNPNNETGKNTDKGEPEDIYIEDGKVYKSYIEVGSYDNFKLGRGIIGLKDDGSMIYHTLETSSTANYNKVSPSVSTYNFDSYILEVLGENANNAVYEYPLLSNGVLNYMAKPAFYTPDMGAKDLVGATVYAVKCSQYRRAHSGINGEEIGTTGYCFEGEIESVFAGNASTKAPAGYVYLATYQPLEHLQVGTSVRGTKKMSGDWADVPYVFGFKQQILLDGQPLFDDALQEAYGDTKKGSWNAWTEDVQYASYGSNRTAVGFKADGTPVIIAMPRKVYYNTDGSYKGETSATYYEMAWYMKSLGCVNAFMLDCGRSTRMYKKSTDSTDYAVTVVNPSNTKGGAPIEERPVANALILAYPSGQAANPTDKVLEDPEFTANYITSQTNPNWIAGNTKYSTTATTSEKSYSFYNGSSYGTEISNSQFKLGTQGNTVYNFTPGTVASGYEAVYAYTKLGYTVEEGRKYVYCFKLHTVTAKIYTSFLFGEYPANTSSKKTLNNFAVVGGAFSNNGDSGGSDIRVGVGRVKGGTSEIQGSNTDIDLYLESESSKSYSFYRIDIDGLNYTVKTMDSSGTWVQIGGTYTLPAGTQLIMGCAAWTSDFALRKMSVKDVVCVDVTDISRKAAEVDSLNEAEYTPESWASLKAAQTKAVYSAKIPYVSLVNNANTQLDNAKAGLVSYLDLANEEYENKSSYEKTYTAESWAAYKAAHQALINAKSSGDVSAIPSLYQAYTVARDALVDSLISLEILWQDIIFTYSESGMKWDPHTHIYESAQSSQWISSQDSNHISITNNSNVDVKIALEFEATDGFDGLCGEFYDNGEIIENDFVIARSTSKEIEFLLDGSIPATTPDKTLGGAVRITVSS